ncbi:MAG: hypothetical protein BWY50_01960 [Spirochaetes bacterium ADurb.Bin315]|nr:MAG: hypothetical protein BWY50_01960 [Spirochaetes bacterium ADurb.Bin315]
MKVFHADRLDIDVHFIVNVILLHQIQAEHIITDFIDLIVIRFTIKAVDLMSIKRFDKFNVVVGQQFFNRFYIFFAQVSNLFHEEIFADVVDNSVIQHLFPLPRFFVDTPNPCWSPCT